MQEDARKETKRLVFEFSSEKEKNPLTIHTGILFVEAT